MMMTVMMILMTLMTTLILIRRNLIRQNGTIPGVQGQRKKEEKRLRTAEITAIRKRKRRNKIIVSDSALLIQQEQGSIFFQDPVFLFRNFSVAQLTE